MGLIARVLQFVRVDREGAQVVEVTTDSGGDVNTTSDQYAPLGVDAPPLPGDYALLASVPRSGGRVIVAYADPVNAGAAEGGEYRTYARDANGAIVVEVWLRGDGSVLISNASGSFELAASGDVTINGLTIATDGSLSTPGGIESLTGVAAPSVAVAGIELSTHVHVSAAPGSPTGPPTGPPAP